MAGKGRGGKGGWMFLFSSILYLLGVGTGEVGRRCPELTTALGLMAVLPLMTFVCHITWKPCESLVFEPA